MLVVFDAAGLAESHLGWLQGNFFAEGTGPTQGDVCEGARGPLEHSHFFTDTGEFGSYDENGNQVDNGDYELVDGNTLGFPSHASEFGYDGELTVDFAIDGDVAVFDVVLPEDCDDPCKDAYAWALSAFASARGRAARSPAERVRTACTSHPGSCSVGARPRFPAQVARWARPFSRFPASGPSKPDTSQSETAVPAPQPRCADRPVRPVNAALPGQAG